ncbi:MAG TPA: hypothetical protein V6D17_02455 [Candidatus Obscuribacterales bacterium]
MLHSRKFFNKAISFSLIPYIVSAILWPPAPASALETSPAATTAASSEFSLEPDTKENQKERKEVENFLKNIEEQWNAHNLEGVMSQYADEYINNDGLDKKAVAALTQEFWSRYPDAKSSSKTKEIRIDGQFATVESRDMATGTTDKENQDIGTKGELNSISEGQLYLKKIGSNWKIIGDRIDYEKVRVSFGLAKQLNANFSAPEQVKSGRQYSAKLEVSLPVGLSAVGSITSQPLQYPQPQPNDSWRPLDGSTLERVMPANTKNRNELLMATLGITNASRSHLMGITVLTRRLNVVPETTDEPAVKKEKTLTSEKSAIETSQEKKDEKKDAETSEEKKDAAPEADNKKQEVKEAPKSKDNSSDSPSTAPKGKKSRKGKTAR